VKQSAYTHLSAHSAHAMHRRLGNRLVKRGISQERNLSAKEHATNTHEEEEHYCAGTKAARQSGVLQQA
jgi:hypothetical protein